MPRAWILWLQLIIGWLPIWALFTTLLVAAHPVPILDGALIALRMMLAAAVLGLLVHRLTDRLPWPQPVRPSFIGVHLLAAGAYAVGWLLLNGLIESVLRGQVVLVTGPGPVPFLVLGVWLYVMIAGVTYATRATERAARAEASAARSQLAALRAQLNPHFLFNALHTVVQLIPREPARASMAAEKVAGLLRTTLEEDRDLVTLGEEWEFARRYLDIESIRFGDRLRVASDLSDEARDALVPAFSVQTLIENAVRHGAAPQVEATAITVTGRAADGMVIITVHDTGAGATDEAIQRPGGTGIRKLRERLAALYGRKARLDLDARPGSGFTASLSIPWQPDE
jgi:signal transduction histidine kinase